MSYAVRAGGWSLVEWVPYFNTGGRRGSDTGGEGAGSLVSRTAGGVLGCEASVDLFHYNASAGGRGEVRNYTCLHMYM